MKAAVIIGSNSLRMLVDTFPKKTRFRQETRLFAKLDKYKNIPKEDILQLANYINLFINKAASLGAERFYLGATSAVRDASNQKELCDTVKKNTGLNLNILTGRQEAELSFLGAAGLNKHCGVIDIGGGSTEIAVGSCGVIQKSASFNTGASRLYKKVQINSALDIAKAKSEAAKAFDASFLKGINTPESGNAGYYNAPDYINSGNFNNIDKWYFAGGTAVILAHVLNREKYELPLKDTVLTFSQIENILNILADTPYSGRSLITGVPKGREGILPTGAAILLSLMQMYGISKVISTERTNLDGALMAEEAGKIEFVKLYKNR